MNDGIDASERVLAVAYGLLEDQGVGFSLREVERDAGIGSSTMRRLFPSKEALIAAVVREDLEYLATVADRLMAYPRADEAFFEWARELAAIVLTTHGLAAMLANAASQSSSGLHCMSSQLLAVTRELLHRGQREGRILPDLLPEEAFVLGLSAAWCSERLHPAIPKVGDATRESTASKLLRAMEAGLRVDPLDPEVEGVIGA